MFWKRKSSNPPGWASHLGTLERFEQFIACVREHFVQRGEDVEIDDGFVRSPTRHDWRCGLMNLSQLCARVDEEAWPAIVAEHFGMIERSQDETADLGIELADYSRIAGQIGVRLYEPEDIAEVLDKSVTREDIPGLLTVLCLDMPSSVATLTREQVEPWGIDEDALFAQALANLRSLCDAEREVIELEEGAGRIVAMQGPSFFNASLILQLTGSGGAERAKIEDAIGRHGAFVSVPTRHILLAMPFDDPGGLHAISALMTISQAMYRDGPGSVSDRVWWTDGSRWIEIPYEFDNNDVKVYPPEDFVELLNKIASDE